MGGVCKLACARAVAEALTSLFHLALARRGMACVVCLDARAELCCVPCGHLCICRKCMQPSKCPVCRLVVQQTLRVSFSGAVLQVPQQQPPRAAVETARMLATRGPLLALTDKTHAELELTKEIEAVEQWVSFAPAKELHVEEAMELLGIEVSDDVQRLLDCGDNKAYAEGVIRVIERQWRAIALRMHPDKQCASWSSTERRRLRCVYDYYNEAQEMLRRAYAQYLHPSSPYAIQESPHPGPGRPCPALLARYCVSPVENIGMCYSLTESNGLCAELKWEEGRDMTIIRWADEVGDELEIFVEASENSHTFTEEAYPYMFTDEFEGYILTHVRSVCRFHGTESLEVRANEPVPLRLQEAQLTAKLWNLRAQLEDLTRSCKRRRMCEAPAPWRSGRKRKHHRRQVCLLHDPARGLHCNAWACWRERDHIDRRSARGQRRWVTLMASISRSW